MKRQREVEHTIGRKRSDFVRQMIAKFIEVVFLSQIQKNYAFHERLGVSHLVSADGQLQGV